MKRKNIITILLFVFLLCTLLLGVSIVIKKQISTEQFHYIVISLINILCGAVIGYFWSVLSNRGGIYLLVSEDTIEFANRVKNCRSVGVVQLSTELYPGSNINKVCEKMIKRARICYVLIGKNDSYDKNYKEQIRIMKRLEKSIIPVLCYKESIVPSTLKKYQSQKIEDLI